MQYGKFIAQNSVNLWNVVTLICILQTDIFLNYIHVKYERRQTTLISVCLLLHLDGI